MGPSQQLSGLLFVPAGRFPDKDSLGFKGGRIEGEIHGVDGEFTLMVEGWINIPSEAAFTGDGGAEYKKLIYADLEVQVPDGPCYRTVHTLKSRYAMSNRVISRESDWYLAWRREFYLSTEIPLAHLRLPEGKLDLPVSIKLYTFTPDTNRVGMMDENTVRTLDRIPFFVKNGQISVDVPQLEYAELTLNRLELSGSAAGGSYDSHVPILGSGKADLVYQIRMNRSLVYRSSEYTNASIIRDRALIPLAFQPQEPAHPDTLWIILGDDDDGFFGIGEKVDYIGRTGYVWPDPNQPPRMVFTDSAFIVTGEIRKR